MRKLLNLLSVTAICLFIVCGCIACNKPCSEHIDVDPQDNICDICGAELDKHEHTYDESVWEKNESTHWHPATCEHENEKGNEAAHVDADGDELCDVCQFQFPHIHKFDTKVWKSDEFTHWHPATCGHDNEKGNESAHVDEDEDELCDICQFQFPHIHKFDTNEWKNDEFTHWHPATCGHDNEKGNESAHVDEDEDELCDVCQFQLPHIHKFDTEVWESDESTHWHPATCGHDNEKGNESAHVDRDDVGICDVCGETVEQRKLTVIDCLMPIVSELMTGSLVLDADVAVGERKVDGCIYINANMTSVASLSAQQDFLSSLMNLLRKLEIRANFGGIELWYYDHTAYIAFGGTKLALSVEELMSSFSTSPELMSETDEEEDLLTRLMNVTVTRDKEAKTASFRWEIEWSGGQIPVTFLFDVEKRNITLNNIGIGLQLLGTEISGNIKYAETDTAPEDLSTEERDAFVNVTDIIAKIPELSTTQAFALNGSLNVVANGKEFGLTLNNISLNRALDNVYVDLSLNINNTVHDITIIVNLERDTDNIVICYDEFGIRVNKTDFEAIKNAFMAIIGRITAIADEFYSAPQTPELPDGSTDSEPNVAALIDEETTGNIFDGLSGIIEFAQSLPEIIDMITQIDLGDLLAGLFGYFNFDECVYDDGFLRVSIGDFAIELKLPEKENGFIGLYADYMNENTEVSAVLDLSLITSEDYPALPAVRYFDKDDILDLIEFADVAMDIVESDDLNLEFTSTVTSSDEKYVDSDGVKMNVKGALEYYCDAAVPVTLGTDNKGRKLVVDSELYLHLSLALVATHDSDKSLYLDISAIDLDKEGNSDGELDFYVTVSCYDKEDTEHYAPLSFYVPSGDLMKLLSEVVAVLGLDNDILNELLVLRRLDELSVDRLKAVGDFLMPLVLSLITDFDVDKLMGVIESIGDYLNDFLGGNFAPAPDETGISLMAEGNRSGIIESMQRVSEDVTENDEVIGKSVRYIITLTGGENIVLMRTETTKNSSLSFVLDNIKGDIKDLSIVFDNDEIVKPESIRVDNYFDGISEIVSSLADSVTHTEGDTAVFNDYFYFDGTVTASLLGIVNIDLNFSLSLRIDENGKLSVDAHLSYQGLYVNLILIKGCVINGDTDVDISIRDGLIYIRRVQTSDCTSSKEAKLDQPVTLYRVMPLSAFTEDTVNQIAFILNFGEFIAQYLPSGNEKESGSNAEQPLTEPETPSEPETPTEPALDYGAILAQYLKSYSYTSGESGQSWDIYLDGNLLTNGILNALNVRINAGEDGKIENVEILKETAIKIPDVNLSVSLNGKINFRNSGFIMDNEIKDITVDVRELMSDEVNGDIADIATKDWAERLFLEYKEYEVEYVIVKADESEESLSKQKLFLTTGGDGREENLLYSSLVYPKLDKYSEEGKFNAAWEQNDFGVGKKLDCDGKIRARQSKCKYTIVFIADEKITDDWKEISDGKYSYETELYYNDKVTFMANGKPIGEVTITADAATNITLPEKPLYMDTQDISSYWTVRSVKDGIVFTVFYDLDTVNYNSAIKFTYNNEDYNEYSEQFVSDSYTLITPTAQGYIFLGWFEHTADGWKQITTIEKTETPKTTKVEALWIADFSITTVKGSIIKPSTAEASVDATALYGSPAADFTSKSVKYAFVLDNNETCSSYGTPSDSNSASARGSKNYAHLQVTLTYTLADGREITFVIEKTKKF